MMYTVQEIADMFQANYRTVLTWIDEGRLEAIRIKQVIRVTEPSLQKFLEESKYENKEK